jgi:hypothetical protein
VSVFYRLFISLGNIPTSVSGVGESALLCFTTGERRTY